jgi:hypothetical protein
VSERPALQLLATGACSLCEQAEALLATLSLPQPLEVEWVDISEDEVLLALYAERIPLLLHRGPTEVRELGWPFTQQQALLFLRECGSSHAM